MHKTIVGINVREEERKELWGVWKFGKGRGKIKGKGEHYKSQIGIRLLQPDVYIKRFFDTKTGGYVVTDRQRITAAKKIKQEGEKYEKERDMSLVFAKGGNKIVHRREVPGVSSADVLFNGLPADLKKTSSYDQIVKYAKYATHKQGAKLVLFQFDKWNAKMASELKKLQELKIHGKYFVTDKEDEIIDF
ncbi:MAG: hypothetical protein PHR53_09295 [Bacteroidales bacterium]|nr:hypothetical protein [Bacteroidales bacterium]